MSVLDEQQRIGDKWRDRGEFRVNPLGIVARVDADATAIEQPQTGVLFLLVERITPIAHKIAHPQRRHSLLLDHEMPGAQLLDEGRELRIAQALVVGTGLREPDLAIRSRCQREGYALGQPTETDRLQE